VPDQDIAALEARNRQHAEVEGRVKTLATGASHLPFHRHSSPNERGLLQSAISDIQNGEPATNGSDVSIERIFSTLVLGRRSRTARYVEWWRDNAPPQ
jgi:hypothetical protein